MSVKSIFFFTFFLAQCLFADKGDFEKYFEYLDYYSETLGPYASFKQGEIEIIREKEQMLNIAKQTQRTVGVVAEDKYWIWLNDAVRFPNGSYGVYSRVIWKQSLEGIAGVAILPVLPNGKIALNRNFRHATRSWEYELPRGGLQKNETPAQGALREMKEETGLVADKIEFLGNMNPDSGLTNSCIPIYLAQVSAQKTATPEYSEAIASIDLFTLSELKEGFRKGYLETKVSGEIVRANLRDPFLAFALLQWDIRQ